MANACEEHYKQTRFLKSKIDYKNLQFSLENGGIKKKSRLSKSSKELLDRARHRTEISLTHNNQKQFLSNLFQVVPPPLFPPILTGFWLCFWFRTDLRFLLR